MLLASGVVSVFELFSEYCTHNRHLHRNMPINICACMVSNTANPNWLMKRTHTRTHARTHAGDTPFLITVMCCSNLEDHPSSHIKAKPKTIHSHVILDKNHKHTVSVKWWVIEKMRRTKYNLMLENVPHHKQS